jgi:hypothetical protein
MPLYEFMCDGCESIIERYFQHVDTETEVIQCLCGKLASRIPSVPAFTEFVPFTTNNIMPDGSAVHVSSRSQLRGLLREHKLVEVGNDPVRAMFGSNPKSVAPVRPISKRSGKSHAVPLATAQEVAKRAEITDFGRRSV